MSLLTIDKPSELFSRRIGLSLSLEGLSEPGKKPVRNLDRIRKRVYGSEPNLELYSSSTQTPQSRISPQIIETPPRTKSCKGGTDSSPQSSTHSKSHQLVLSLFGSTVQSYKPQSHLAEIRKSAFQDFSETDEPLKTIVVENAFQDFSETDELLKTIVVLPIEMSSNENMQDLPIWQDMSLSSPKYRMRRPSFQTSEDHRFIKELSVKGMSDFNAMIGIDLCKLEVEGVVYSQFGAFLQKRGYEIVELLKTDGANSYCFSIKKDDSSELEFLKVLKPKNWDAPSLRNCTYSEERGSGWLMKNKEGIRHTLVPDVIIVVNKSGKITAECETGDLILATVSPMVNAMNLKSLIEKEKLKEQDIPKLITKILEAVDIFKQKNMTHRDLTPQNILINPETLDVWIIDFDHGTTGVCKPLEGCYAAPESSSKIDEFTLGLVLLEMCTGKKPSDPAEDPTTIYRDEILEGRIPLSTVPGRLRPIVPIIQGFLEVDPEKRWDAGHALEYWRKLIDSE